MLRRFVLAIIILSEVVESETGSDSLSINHSTGDASSQQGRNVPCKQTRDTVCTPAASVTCYYLMERVKLNHVKIFPYFFQVPTGL